jgi:hypothetical protein
MTPILGARVRHLSYRSWQCSYSHSNKPATKFHLENLAHHHTLPPYAPETTSWQRNVRPPSRRLRQQLYRQTLLVTQIYALAFEQLVAYQCTSSLGVSGDILDVSSAKAISAGVSLGIEAMRTHATSFITMHCNVSFNQ